ncbi:MAG: hypothetical protein PHH08_05075 [Candidatus ainarchaeum sp.]|nr:hypothetical protein [Candidatus ainarchaeum sp.]
MALVSELQFAQKYPFTNAAKKIIRGNNLSLEELPEEIVSRAGAMVTAAAKNRDYSMQIHSSGLLLQEILAFPIAKIFVSLQKDTFLNEKFAMLFSKTFLKYIDLEKHKQETALDLLRESGVKFEVIKDKNFFLSLPLQDFLKIPFKHASLKLVNQAVSKGKVFLKEGLFYTFVSEIVFSQVYNSLPVPLEGIPNSLKISARQFQQQLAVSRKRDFEFKLSGTANPGIFPSCMQSMYNSLLEGKNLQHSGRFYIAAFLNSIGLPKEQIIQLFAKTPNFNEKMTRYQVDRLVKQNFSPPSCAKIKEAGLCTDEECGEKHPLGYYKKAFSSKQEKPWEKKKIAAQF